MISLPLILYLFSKYMPFPYFYDAKKSLSPLCITTTMKGILNSIDIVYFPTLANA